MFGLLECRNMNSLFNCMHLWLSFKVLNHFNYHREEFLLNSTRYCDQSCHYFSNPSLVHLYNSEIHLPWKMRAVLFPETLGNLSSL
jgi:hypothetical protein